MYDAPIWHYGLPNQVSLTTNHFGGSFGISEVGMIQDGMFKTPTDVSSAENGVAPIDMSQASSSQIGFPQSSPSQISRIQTSIPDNGVIEFGSVQNSTTQVGTTQVGTTQVGISEHGSSEVDSSQVQFGKIDVGLVLNQFNTSKITLPSTISNNQFFSTHSPELNNIVISHDSTSNYLTQLQSTLANYWPLPNNLNLNFNITNLPSGQLAEATITGYDSNGRPNTATITIDDDANGVGWFLDSTPGDNSEFQGVGALGSGGVGE